MNRPPVLQRFRALMAEEEATVRSRPELGARVALSTLVHLCARLGFTDVPVTRVLEAYVEAVEADADPASRRTGSEVEARSLACLDLLRPQLAEVARAPADRILAALDEDQVVEALCRVPTELLLEQMVMPGWPFELLCWNAANAALEGAETPYRAAHRIVHAGYFRPDDRFALLPALTELTERYFGGDPDERPNLGMEILAVLAAYVERAPYPR